MNQIQNRISGIVEEYKGLFTDEYMKVCNSIADKREVQETEFASIKGDGDGLRQLVHEIPLTLHNMFDNMLTEEERTYFKSKEGAEWFGRTFKEFSPAQNI